MEQDTRARAGVVYHPEFDQCLVGDALARREVVAKLQLNADSANCRGDRALRDRDWGLSDRNWRYAARCMRTAQAISGCRPVVPEDYPIVRQAWLQLRSGQPSQDLEVQT